MIMLLILGFLALGCPNAKSAETGSSLLNTIRALSSDEFEGRAPGTPGEEKTVAFIVNEMKKIGLQPGNPNGTYFQEVPVLSFNMDYQTSVVTAGHSTLELAPNKDIVAVTHHDLPEVQVRDSDIVFVGYGVVAPEYGWDDYKGMNVKGKTLLMLVNDPQVPDPKDPTRLDDGVFEGKAMTYYGRWTYKYEIAQKKGAAGAIIIHDDFLAGYPFSVVANSWGHECFDIRTADKNLSRPAIEAWITTDKAKEILKGSGQDLESLKKAAVSRDFHPVVLNARLNAKLKRSSREILTKNVVGILPGSDPRYKNRYLIYSAHWDHFGKDPKLSGDPIFHGALDNAAGVAALLETAKEFRVAKKPAKSSVVFVATTGEERNMLGSNYYVQHPLYPLSETLADLNFDGLNPWGRTKDMQLVGKGYSDLPERLDKVLKKHGRVLVPESDTEKGMFFRTDQIEFTKAGVPSLWCHFGKQYIGKSPEYGDQKIKNYILHDYHKPTDVIQPDWEMSGAVEDLHAFFELGYEIAQSRTRPKELKHF